MIGFNKKKGLPELQPQQQFVPTKSIVVNISDLDITGQYQYYNLAVKSTIF
jgi:hypothetical protein